MKKLTALLLCFLLLCTCFVTASAAQMGDAPVSAVISATVPDTHQISVSTEHAKVFYEGVSGEVFTVGRLSTPRLLIRAESGWGIKSVKMNGLDVTKDLHGGYLTLEPVYEDKSITVTTEAESASSRRTYTVKGTVTLNGQPLANVDLELRSTVKRDTTDKNGKFSFNRVEPGEHSLTALRGGKVIGYLSFELKESSRADVTLLDDGRYILSVDEDGAGVQVNLVLNEEDGTLIPTGIKNIPKPTWDIPKTGDSAHVYFWLLIMIISVGCIAVLASYRRKKMRNTQT